MKLIATLKCVVKKHKFLYAVLKPICKYPLAFYRKLKARKTSSEEKSYAYKVNCINNKIGKVRSLSISDLYYLYIKNGELCRFDIIVRLLAVENYYGKNDYAVSLKSKQGDIIYLYRTDDERTLQEYYLDLTSKTNLFKGKKYLANNFSNLSHIELININSSELSKRIQNIFSLYETEYSPLINSLFKKIYQKSYSEINDFFIEYILKIENKESSILAPVLLSSNPNFISFRPPYIHTERIKPYTLILDLNDTIINFQQTNNSQGILRLRPFLIEFLEEISHYYELILFTTDRKSVV